MIYLVYTNQFIHYFLSGINVYFRLIKYTKRLW